MPTVTWPGAPSALADRAPVRRPAALHELLHRCLTYSAGLAAAFVYEQLLSKISGYAFRIHIVAQCGAADLDGFGEHVFDGPDQSRGLCPGDAARGAARGNAGAKQRLACIDVAHAHDHVRIHDELFDRDGAFAGGTEQMLGVELLAQRFGGELR